MARPKIYKVPPGQKIVSVPEDAIELWEKLDELAAREGSTRSDLVNRAIAEYLKIHYPGNPQIPLEKAATKTIFNNYMVNRANVRLDRIMRPWADNSGKREALENVMVMIAKIKDPPDWLVKKLEKAIESVESCERGL